MQVGKSATASLLKKKVFDLGWVVNLARLESKVVGRFYRQELI